MSSKQLKTILFIFIILFCISAASAEPLNDNLEIFDMESTADTFTVNDDNDGTFSDLNERINGQEGMDSTVSSNSKSENDSVNTMASDATVDPGVPENPNSPTPNAPDASVDADDVSNYTLKVDDLTKYYGNDGKLVITLLDDHGTPLANRDITILINGVGYSRTTNENGRILMSINLDSGIYKIKAIFKNLECNGTITILSTVSSADVIKYYRNGTQYYATFLDSNGKPLANREVTFNINGVFYKRTTDSNGIAKLSINLNPGKYVITAMNSLNNEMVSNDITVLSTIAGKDIVKYFRNGTQYYATFLDSNGKPLANREVTFNINGVFYTRQTDENGTAKLSINLNPGKYIITAVNPVNTQSYSNVIEVLKTINSKDIEMSSQNRQPFKVTVLNGEGKPLSGVSVTFNINGVFYQRVTDAEGVAQLNMNLVAGKYIITTTYNELSVSNTVLIR